MRELDSCKPCRFFWEPVLLGIFLLGGGLCSRAQSGASNGTLYFLSDCQKPLLLELLHQKPYRNEEARDSLFTDLVRQKPLRVFLLGDLTSWGAHAESWKPLDSFLSRLSALNTKVSAIPGNHEYIGNAKKGISNYRMRFPACSIFGYCVGCDSLAVIMLNSNFDNLTSSEAGRQQWWYSAAMDSLERDGGVTAIIVCTHHAPYTNSTVVGWSKQVHEHFLPLFVKSSKAILFISGHSHNLEFFQPYPHKYFLVIGGGGGLAQPLRPPQKALTPDLISPNQKPLYFYAAIRRHGDSLMVTARGFRKDFGSKSELEIATIRIPQRKTLNVP